ncbi:MAG: energy-coupling factor transporter transmembrane protein EcfT [Peptostreptococcaceae bacterium]|jgi:energy-coupling factor transport system permease protein|nr:energy-coupling factor transporter transmembrane protein EcfT [Peptostreptococcaceae bacterium]
MLKDITIGQFYPVDSLLHKIDPRVKIIATFLFMLSLFVVNNFYGYLIVLAYLATVIAISKVPLKYMLKGLKPIFMIILLTFSLNIFLTPGEIVFKFSIFKITKEGLYQGTFMALRLILLIIGTSILTLVTSPIKLTDGIEKLLDPFKKIGVPSHEIAMMMTIALRFIPTLLDETDKIMKAQMARGADFEKGGIIKKAKSMIPLLVPLFISAFRRADELAMAMEARCYRGGNNRTRMKEIKIESRDYVALLFIAIYMIIIIMFRFLF